MCVVKVDATNGVARVIFENSRYLGIEWENYNVTDVITIPEGEIAEITIYNGAETGPALFDISFSGANGFLFFAMAAAFALSTYAF